MTATLFPSNFFLSEMLQVAHSEPAAWKAAVALGALHRKWECTNAERRGQGGADQAPGPEDQATRFSRQAIGHYVSAVSLVQEVNEPKLAIVLSVALAAVANLAGMWQDSQVHVRSGLRLLVQMLDQNPDERQQLENVIQSLVKLDIMAMTFNDDRAPYVFTQFDSAYAALGHRAGSASLEGAASDILPLFRYALFLYGAQEEGKLPEPEGLAAQARLENYTAMWEQNLKRLLDGHARQQRNNNNNTDNTDNTKYRRSLNCLKLYQSTLRALITTTFVGPETRWDACLPYFERIVSAAEIVAKSTNFPFSFFLSLEPGVVMPLFLTAIRCRHPITRRRALTLLRNLNWQEGMWDSHAAAIVAEQIVVAEEHGLDIGLPLSIDIVMPSTDLAAEETWLDNGGPSAVDLWGAWPVVPERQRVVRNKILADMGLNCSTIELSLEFATPDEAGGLRTVSKSISL
jgi:hypothetical protein